MKALSDTKEKILFRRSRITELVAKGFKTDSAIAQELGVSRATVNSDIRVLRRQAETDIRTFQTKLPYEYDSMMMGVRLLLKRNWEIFDDVDSSEKTRVNASHTILSCYEEIREQLEDKFEIMAGLATYHTENNVSLEEQAYRDAREREYRESQRVF